MPNRTLLIINSCGRGPHTFLGNTAASLIEGDHDAVAAWSFVRIRFSSSGCCRQLLFWQSKFPKSKRSFFALVVSSHHMLALVCHLIAAFMLCIVLFSRLSHRRYSPHDSHEPRSSHVSVLFPFNGMDEWSQKTICSVRL